MRSSKYGFTIREGYHLNCYSLPFRASPKFNNSIRYCVAEGHEDYIS